ncbi:MAG: amino acid adenylation domain-containing protein [Acidimicrobiia bacterium]
MRTVITTSAGSARQRVSDAIDFTLPVVDLSDRDDPFETAQVWAQEQCAKPLDIERLTFDAALLRLGEDRYAWYLNQHHVVTDAWAFGVLYSRMSDLYVAALEGNPPASEPLAHYADYIAHERATRLGGGHESRNSRANRSVAPTLYGSTQRAESTLNERVKVEMSLDRSDAVRLLAATPGIQALTPDLSLFQVFATAVFAYVHRVSGQTAITLGAPVHNRSTTEFRRTAGLFMEVYPLELVVDDDDTFATLHAKVRTATASFLRSAKPGHAEPDDGRRITTVLNFITAGFNAFAGMPVHADWLHSGHVDAHHQLRLQVHDFNRTGRFTVAFDASVAAFDVDQRHQMPVHFERIVDAMLADWDGMVTEVDLLSTDERRAVIEAVNEPRGAPARTNVVSEFLERAAETPTASAVVEGDLTLSYRDVDELTARVAGGIDADSVIGIALPRSHEAVVAMLGVLRAGATYVPIDPRWPTERIRFVVEDAECATVIANDDFEVDIETSITRYRDCITRSSEGAVDIEPTDLAYILYTSGSTGIPKGVMIEHSAMANYLSWARSFYDRGDRLTFPLFTPLTFDLTVTSVWVPLMSGGTIRVYREKLDHVDLAVLDVLRDDAVDIVKLTPSHLALISGMAPADARIRQMILGGEDLTVATARRAYDSYGGRLAIHNEYGPTEGTVGCIVHTYDPVSDVAGSVPIGRPIDGMRAYVLDAAGHPVPFGVPGDLWIAGAGVARGYVDRADLTEERFREGVAVGEPRMYATGDIGRVRADGTIEYLGRRDDQVKIRGVRVELGEVEAAVASHPRITAAAARIWGIDDPEARPAPVYCARCGLASDYPGISYDADRICSECRAFEGYAERARVYFKPESELEAILTSRRSDGRGYDCLALLSGGKDSTYVLCRLVDMGLRVLAFTLDNGYISDQAKANIQRTVDTLGVDHVFASTPAMNDIFVDSLQRHANVCQGCFKTIYTLSMQTARERRIPFIVTGLSRGQFFETRLTEELFTELTVSSDQIDANVLEARRAYHQVDDAVNRLLDTSMFDDGSIFDDVRYVDFYRYVDVSLDEVYSYLDGRVPWVRPTDTGRSTNCLINDVGIYYHRKTRGYHNYALPYSWDVRMGHKTRDAALEELDDDIDVTEVARILEEIGFPDDFSDVESGQKLVSYYVAPVEIPTPELRSHVAATLPHQIVPSQFVRVDSLPLSHNGKVERSALPSPDGHRPSIDTTFVAPHTDAERILTQIWEQILGIEGIGVRDNYFDLGGDSITAVQIIARAHRAGMPITLSQLFETLTVESLVAVAGDADAMAADRVVGAIGITPIQRWFFEEHREPGHFHHIVRIALPAAVDAQSVRSALGVLRRHHDALRQSFELREDGWHSGVADTASEIPLDVIRVEGFASPALLDAEGVLHAPFDLGSPPLMRALLASTPDGSTRLIIAAHHLIVDAASWSHFIDDLGDLLDARTDAGGSPLPGVMTSIRDWTDHLQSRVDAIDPGRWAPIVEAEVAPWPLGDETGPTLAVRTELTPAQTADLLSKASEWRLGVDEILITGLVHSLADLTDSDRVRIFLEGHGRDSDSARLDVTRTLGWFTALFPALVRVDRGLDPRDGAGAVRDQLRPAIGWEREYGIARYLHPDVNVRQSMRLDHREHAVFNYLGRVAASPAAGETRLAGPIELSRPEDTAPVFGLEVTAFVEADRMIIDWTGNTADAASMADGARRMVDVVAAVIDDSSATERLGQPLRPFDLAGLDESGMQNLAAALRVAEGGR